MINQALPQVTIERTLAQLRWRPADFDEATLLRRIAEYPAYWLLLHDGEPLLAPDDRDRRLAAVFTSESARDACLAEPGLTPAGAKVKRCENCLRDCDNATMTVSSSTAWDQTVRLPLCQSC